MITVESLKEIGFIEDGLNIYKYKYKELTFILVNIDSTLGLYKLGLKEIDLSVIVQSNIEIVFNLIELNEKFKMRNLKKSLNNFLKK